MIHTIWISPDWNVNFSADISISFSIWIWISPDWNVNIDNSAYDIVRKHLNLNITRLECKSDVVSKIHNLSEKFEYHQIGM